jgi:hypothetical protein
MARIRKGQVRNIDGRDITAQARFIANLFDVAAELVSLVRRIPLSPSKTLQQSHLFHRLLSSVGRDSPCCVRNLVQRFDNEADGWTLLERILVQLGPDHTVAIKDEYDRPWNAIRAIAGRIYQLVAGFEVNSPRLL